MSPHRRLHPGSLAILLLAGLAACAPRIDDGQFDCDPRAPGSCPDGFSCRYRRIDDGFRCLRPGSGYCGDEVLDPGEACDGSRVPVTCLDLGRLGGSPTCTTGCEIDASGCRDATALSCGSHHCCALDGEGDAWCWGAHRVDPEDHKDFMFLGTNESTFRPERVAAGLNLREITAGERHTCAVSVAGEAYCWGFNGFGQLGEGSHEASTAPTLVSGGPWRSLAAAALHTCGLDEAGAAHCWGDHEAGQLGNGEPFPDYGRVYPGPVASDERFVSITAAGTYTCALTGAGEARCWGSNLTYQLGDGSEVEASPVPVAVSGGLRFARLRTGPFHACGVDAVGQTWCWGYNREGQLGHQSPVAQNQPMPLPGALRLGAVEPGGSHTCGLDGEGQAWCWGHGPLGGEALASVEPVRVTQAQPLAALASGLSHACGLGATGGIWCWGWNGAGAVGQDTGRALPSRVGTPDRFVAIRAQGHVTCGIAATGEAQCWGANALGQLGAGTTTQFFTPVPAVATSRFGALSVGTNLVCGVDDQARLLCWGLLPPHQNLAFFPVSVGPDQAWSEPAVGYLHACALDQGGAAWCWGDNTSGQLGSGLTGHETCAWGNDCSAEPARVSGGLRFTHLAAGFAHTCGLSELGEVHCWGDNLSNQVGDVLDFDVAEPLRVDLPVAGSVTAVAAGVRHTCALDDTGQAWCWGSNSSYGGLGNGSIADSPSPVRVALNRPLTTLAVGVEHSCGLETSGDAWCWGRNVSGQLGDGTHQTQLTPIRVVADRPFAALAIGYGHTCALDTEGAAWCWGRDEVAQLAADDFFPTPVLVGAPGCPAGSTCETLLRHGQTSPIRDGCLPE